MIHISPSSRIKDFVASQSGAITVNWTGFAAAVVGLGTSRLTEMENRGQSLPDGAPSLRDVNDRYLAATA